MWITPRIGAAANLYCPYRTLSPSLSTARIGLSLSHAVALLFYRVDMSVLVTHYRLLVYRTYILVLVTHYRSPCLPHRYVCSCPTLSPSLFIARVCLSLSHAVPLLVYRANTSALVARCCSPRLPHRYVCPYRALLLSLSNDARQGKH